MLKKCGGYQPEKNVVEAIFKDQRKLIELLEFIINFLIKSIYLGVCRIHQFFIFSLINFKILLYEGEGEIDVVLLSIFFSPIIFIF